MFSKKTQNGQRKSLLAGASVLAAAAAAMSGSPAMAQDADEEDVIVVTGTRITVPGIESASPITSVSAEEMDRQNEPEIERILATMPSTLAADGQNRNNGTAGTATVNLRGLGSNRNLVMIDGRRLVPFGAGGVVDLQQIPTSLVERIDIITGGASAVYGSDAISGAINFVMNQDFEGVEFDYNRSLTGENDGEINQASVTIGANVADGRGNVALSMSYVDRDPVLLGQRPLGQLGIVTADGGGYANFLAGNGPTLSAGTCAAENAVVAGGSTTTIPTRIAIPGAATVLTGAGLQQFRTDGTLGTNCSVFNFNPYNYYQTPLERFGATGLASYEVNENMEAYGRFTFSDHSVRQQIAPSGVFGTTMFVNMDNPLIGLAARNGIIAAAEANRASATPLIGANNWVDNDLSGTVTAPDDILLSIRRRTVEFGPRSTTYQASTFQVAAGVRGQIGDTDWDYDVYVSQGGVDQTQINAGYTNVAHIADQLLTTDGVTCRDTGDPSCVPLNLFGPPITDALAIGYGSATAIQAVSTEQFVFSAVLAGEMPIHSPWATSGIGVSGGYEYRSESAESVPDECLKLQPASCLGGAGGVTLPLAGAYDVNEVFVEAIVPLVQDQSWAQSLDLELGYRQSDYNLSGVNETYKVGMNYEPMDGLRFRAMRQRAARAPNVSELFFPRSSGLANALLDPCSVAQPLAGQTPALQALCVSTGMTAGQVWNVSDGVVAGQVQAFFGTDPANLPAPEEADTTTIGLVFSPDVGDGVFHSPVVTLDWYKIEIDKIISTFGGQEILDGCYVGGITALCSTIVRQFGELGLPGAGIQLFTTNLLRAEAEGIELGARFGVNLGGAGELTFAFNGNKYMAQETQSASFVPAIDCLGYYGNQCGNPLPEYRWTQRTTWQLGDFEASYLWRHFGETSIEPAQISGTFPVFQQIEAFDYFDLFGRWSVTDNLTLDASVRNVTEEEPPVLGNEAGTTSTNSGNTFPSVFETLGRVVAVGVNIKF